MAYLLRLFVVHKSKSVYQCLKMKKISIMFDFDAPFLGTVTECCARVKTLKQDLISAIKNIHKRSLQKFQVSGTLFAQFSRCCLVDSKLDKSKTTQYKSHNMANS